MASEVDQVGFEPTSENITDIRVYILSADFFLRFGNGSSPSTQRLSPTSPSSTESHLVDYPALRISLISPALRVRILLPDRRFSATAPYPIS